MTTTKEKGQITARVSQPVVDKLQEAADRSGLTLDQFLIEAALEKAARVSEPDLFQTLSARDVEMIIRMLEHPSGPNDALKRAFQRHAKEVAHGNYVRQTDEDS